MYSPVLDNRYWGYSYEYSDEFKRKCATMHREGKLPETPEWIIASEFHMAIRQRVRREGKGGSEALKHQTRNKVWTAEEQYKLVAKALAEARTRQLHLKQE